MAQYKIALDSAMSEFSNVDASQSPQDFVRYLEKVSKGSFIQQIKRQSYELLNIQPGMHLLDVGCGLGDDVRALAQLTGSLGHVVGIDNSQTMIDEASKHRTDDTSNVEFVHGDVHHLPFADATFDACRAERVLIHVEDPAQVVAEMARVVRPGGLVQAVDPDFEASITHLQDIELTRKLTRMRFDSVRNGWIGRRLTSLFQHVDLTNIQVIPNVIYDKDSGSMDYHLSWINNGINCGLITVDEAKAIVEDLAFTNVLHQQFSWSIYFTVVGYKA